MSKLIFTLICLSAFGGAIPCQARTIYVDADANGLNDGSSWPNAYKFLQDALSDANSSPKPVEIRVAQGIYKPDQGAGITPGDRDATFQLINGVTLQGGSAGFGEPDPNSRDIETYKTILSGDLNGDDVDVNNPANLPDEPTRGENSYHIVVGSGTNATAILDGFSITAGHANGIWWEDPPSAKGAGMFNGNGGPTVRNCTFQGNSAIYGGAIYNNNSSLLISYTLFNRNFTFAVCGGDVCSGGTGSALYNNNSSTKLVNCIFTENSTTTPIGGQGGAIFNDKGNHILTDCIFIENSAGLGGAIYNSRVTSLALTGCLFTANSAFMAGGAVANALSNTSVIRCTFISNLAGFAGGGMSNDRSTPTITDSMFNGNLSKTIAGGIYNYQSNTKIINCTFTANQACGLYGGGGAIQNERCTPTLTNCTITGNRALQTGGGVYNCLGGNTILRNCILWDNIAPNGPQIALKETCTEYGCEPSAITVCYSAVLGNREAVYIIGPGCKLNWADGNIASDPCFAKPGYWDLNGTPQDPNDDFWVDGDYHLKSQAGRWDANEGRWTKDDVTSLCIDAGDPNSPIGFEPFPNGGIINMGAYGGTAEASKSYFGEPVCETIVAGDINGDCKVDFKDFALMAFHWLEEIR